TVLVDHLQAPWGLAVVGPTLYFADPDIFHNYAHPSIGSVPIAGGAATTLVTGQRGGRILVVADNQIFWDDGGYEGRTAEVGYAPIAGGSPMVLVPPYIFADVPGMVAASGLLFYSE